MWRSYPTKKGIALTPQCWARLRQSKEQIKDLLRNTNREEEIKIDIGRGIFVSIPVDMPFIHIREWYIEAVEMKPGRKVYAYTIHSGNDLRRNSVKFMKIFQKMLGRIHIT